MNTRRTICLLLAAVIVLSLIIVPLQSLAAEEAPALQDAGFEGSIWSDGIWSYWLPEGGDWSNQEVTDFLYSSDEWMTPPTDGGNQALKFYFPADGSFYFTQVLTDVPAGTYTVTAQSMGADGETVAVKLGDQLGETVQTNSGYNNWTTSSGTFTISEDCAELIVGICVTGTAGGWGYVDNLTLTAEAEEEPPTEAPTEAPSQPTAPDRSMPNADFELGNTSNWTLTGYHEINTNGTMNTTKLLNLWLSDDADMEGSAAYSVSLAAGTYNFSFDIMGPAADSGLTYTVTSGETELVKGSSTITTTGWDVWQTETTDNFTLASDGVVTFTLSGTQPAAYWGWLDNLKVNDVEETEPEPDPEPVQKTELTLENGDFELGNATNWDLTGYSEVSEDQWASNNATFALNLWLSDDAEASGSASYSVTLSAGTYNFTFDLSGAAMDSGLRYTVTAGETELVKGDGTCTTGGWDVWQTETTGDFTLTEQTEVTFTLSGTQPAGYFGDLDNLKLFGTGSVVKTEPEVPPVEADIYVPKISGTGGDFMRGMDVSSLLSILNSGATFKDWDGNELNGQGFMNLVADAGTNWIRLRVWNDPFTAGGNGYGGGNCDVDAAVTMGKWATNAGMKVLIDFHYSDFWADPGKQQAPKAWASYSVDEKAAAIEKYTYDSLKTLLDAGVNVGMVQVGNETTGSICGVSGWENMSKLFSAGSKAVRDIATAYDKDIFVALHFTNPERAGSYANIAKQLDTYGVDYDVFASSYYPYWHGTLDNLTSVLKTVANTYNKYVIVAETSWAYTLDDGDGWDNTVRKNNNDSATYPFTVQGQATEIASVTQAVRNVGDKGIGVFYWESAWIPVQVYDGTAETLNENKALWEKYGSGWASSYATEYDPNDAGKWYGGSAVDNQALFDFEGKPLASLNTYKYIQSGTTGFDIVITGVEEPTLNYTVGDTLALPETVTVSFNVGADEVKAVTWNAGDVAAVDMNTPGTYTVKGIIDGGDTTCTVIVKAENLLKNPSMEESDMSMYTISQAYAKRTTDDPYTGRYSMHFYSSGVVDFTAGQTVTLQPGHYEFSLYGQGGDLGEEASTFAYVKVGSEAARAAAVTEEFALTGWAIWANPTIKFDVTEETEVTVGISVTAAQNGAWGTFDDWYLCEDTNPTHTGGTATCKDQAVCSVCGEAYGDVDATNHTGETEVKDTVSATEESEGYTGDTYCKDCGEKIANGEVIPKLSHTHSMTKTEAKAATEEAAGNIEYYTCAKCGKLYKDAEGKEEITAEETVVPKLTHSHAMVKIPAREATEYTEGNIEYYTCSKCGKLYKDAEGKEEIDKEDTVIEKLPHTHKLRKTAAKKATKYTQGNIEYYTCTKCGKIYKDANGTKEITLKDTVIPKITDNADTGDTAIVAFTALLVLSGAALVLMAKKRKLF